LAESFSVPCGYCIGCRQRRAASWALRATHEASLHDYNSFVTVTYADEHLPPDGELVPEHLSRFFKRLRQALERDRPGLLGDRMRFLACGEYGGRTHRPHYHALLFGVAFSDGLPCARDLFTSPVLEDLWGHGNVSYGAVTGASAAYVAQYSLKKSKREAYVSPDGVVLPPPFLRCSLKPGIGAKWVAKYREDSRHGYIVRDGRKYFVPRYYDKQMEMTDVGLLDASKEARRDSARAFRRTPMELEAAERIELRRLELEDRRLLDPL